MQNAMRTLAWSVLLPLLAAPAVAQHEVDPDSAPRPHGTTFSQGPRDNWTFAAPHLDIDGGVFRVSRTAGDTSLGFVRLHLQTAPGIPLLEVSSDLIWLPQRGATPTWSAVLQVAPLRETSRVYLSAGIGGISGHDAADRLSGWVQAVLAIRTPIHELTPFVQIGKALVDGARAELLCGIAHPLAPYLLHFP